MGVTGFASFTSLLRFFGLSIFHASTLLQCCAQSLSPPSLPPRLVCASARTCTDSIDLIIDSHLGALEAFDYSYSFVFHIRISLPRSFPSFAPFPQLSTPVSLQRLPRPPCPTSVATLRSAPTSSASLPPPELPPPISSISGGMITCSPRNRLLLRLVRHTEINAVCWQSAFRH